MSVFGFDVSLNSISVCVIDAAGEARWRGKALSEPGALLAALEPHHVDIQLVGTEACPLSERLYGACSEAPRKSARGRSPWCLNSSFTSRAANVTYLFLTAPAESPSMCMSMRLRRIAFSFGGNGANDNLPILDTGLHSASLSWP